MDNDPQPEWSGATAPSAVRDSDAIGIPSPDSVGDTVRCRRVQESRDGRGLLSSADARPARRSSPRPRFFDGSRGGRIPQLDRGIATGREEGAAVGREGDPVDRVVVTAERGSRSSGGRVPEAEHLVGSARGEALAVGGEGEIEGRPGQRFQSGEGLPSRRRPRA